MSVNLNKLKEPFPPDAIEWRIGQKSKDKTKGMALAYIDSRMVQDRLDEACGVDGWQCRYSHADASSVSYSNEKDKWDKPLVSSRTLGKTICEIGIKFGEEWIWKADGAGDTDFEAEKGAISDAFKRAAVKWGIGRYLYDISAPWVQIDDFGHIISVELERLRGLLAKDGVKVSGLSGQSKTTAKFWDRTSLILSLPDKIKLVDNKWTEEAFTWWKENFKNGINKAPTRDLLAKYQNDNQHILDTLPFPDSEMFREALEIRANQFDQEKK